MNALAKHNDYFKTTYMFRRANDSYTCIHNECPNVIGEDSGEYLELFNIFDALKDRNQTTVYIGGNLHIIWRIDDSFFGHVLNADRQSILAEDIEHALKNGQFELYYQPQVNTLYNRVVGAEALIRWKHPNNGFISPAYFIPIAEQTGQIVELGKWIMENACFEYAGWVDAGHRNIRMSVNLSIKQLEDDSFIPHMKQVLDIYRVQPSDFMVEVTETVSATNPEFIADILKKIRSVGVQVAIDDFGTGYSALQYLYKFPIDQIKMDKSFTDALDTEAGYTIARFIVDLARNLKYDIIAEGVETPKQLNMLQRMSCFEVQGYLYSPALPNQQFVDYVNSF